MSVAAGHAGPSRYALAVVSHQGKAGSHSDMPACFSGRRQTD